MRHWAGAIAYGFAALSSPACGYRFVGASDAAAVGRVAVLPFKEVAPLGIAGQFMLELTQELMAAGIHVTRSADDADTVLSGTLQVTTVPGATLSTVLVYNVDAMVKAKLHGAQGELLWQFEAPLRDNVLPPDPGSFAEPLTVETRRRVALDRLCRRAAQVVAEALLLRAGTSLGADRIR